MQEWVNTKVIWDWYKIDTRVIREWYKNDKGLSKSYTRDAWVPQYRYKMIRLFSHRKRLVVVFSRNPIKVFCVCRLPLFRPKFVSASAGMSFFREKWLLFGSKATVKGTNKQCEVISHRRRRRWRRQRRRRRSFVDDATNSSFFLATLTELETGGHYPLFAGIPVDWLLAFVTYASVGRFFFSKSV